MLRARDESSFFREPYGRYLSADGVVFWCEGPGLWGVTLWGSLTDAAVQRMIGWIEEEHRHEVAPYDTALDFRRVLGVDGDAFARFRAWYPGQRERQRARVRRAAIVRPESGLAAPVVAGLPEVLGPRIPWTITVDLLSALVWLGVASPDAVASSLDAAFVEASSRPAVLDAVQSALDRNLSAVTVESVAAALGLSVRSLQRQLQAAGTTYDAEVQRARVRRAQRMLTEGDAKLGAVALSAGFTTQAHFNAVFRRITGETPGQWRRRVRGAPSEEP